MSTAVHSAAIAAARWTASALLTAVFRWVVGWVDQHEHRRESGRRSAAQALVVHDTTRACPPGRADRRASPAAGRAQSVVSMGASVRGAGSCRRPRLPWSSASPTKARQGRCGRLGPRSQQTRAQHVLRAGAERGARFGGGRRGWMNTPSAAMRAPADDAASFTPCSPDGARGAAALSAAAPSWPPPMAATTPNTAVRRPLGGSAGSGRSQPEPSRGPRCSSVTVARW